jgi:hypothetical protein
MTATLGGSRRRWHALVTPNPSPIREPRSDAQSRASESVSGECAGDATPGARHLRDVGPLRLPVYPTATLRVVVLRHAPAGQALESVSADR